MGVSQGGGSQKHMRRIMSQNLGAKNRGYYRKIGKKRGYQKVPAPKAL